MADNSITLENVGEKIRVATEVFFAAIAASLTAFETGMNGVNEGHDLYNATIAKNALSDWLYEHSNTEW